MKIQLTIIALFIASFVANAQTQLSKQYIEKYKDIAVSEMKRSGIPASITLAQGMLESSYGNSMLATDANNHFGIKCHSTWTGKKVYKDDDAKDECFRKYKNAKQSYKDHTDFLVNGRRYAFLFELKPTDYKAWAKGLKKAGYATNSKYPQLLIKLIDENELYKFDDKRYKPKGDFVADNKQNKKPKRTKPNKNKQLADVDNFTVNPFGREVKTYNRVEYIIAKKGDTYLKIADEFNMMAWEIPKYNDLEKNSRIEGGQLLYIQPKRSKAEIGNDTYKAKKSDTMYKISQKFAVKLSKLYKNNNMKVGEKIKIEQEIWLRKRIPIKN